MGVLRGSHMRYRHRKFTTKYLSDAFIKAQREVYREMVDSWADGFNKIVNKWNNPPRFYGVVKFEPATKRLFAYVRMTGDKDARDHFNWLDAGLTRNKEVSVPMVGGTTRMMPNKVKIEGVDWPGGKTWIAYPRGIPRARKGKFDKNFTHKHTESKRGYKAYRKKMEKLYTRHLSPRQQATKKYGKDKKMPMRIHKARTGKGGKYRGSGAYFPKKNANKKVWHKLPMQYQVVLGDITARNFTLGLSLLVSSGNDAFRMRYIWPKARTVKQWTRRGYSRGVRYAKAS